MENDTKENIERVDRQLGTGFRPRRSTVKSQNYRIKLREK